MIRKVLCAFTTLGALCLTVGCGGSSSAPVAKPSALDKAKDVAKDLKETGKEAIKDAVNAGKEGLAKLAEITTKELPAIETKLNGLSGDAKAKATEAYEKLKKALEDAKATVTDSEKWKTAWGAITKQLEELKKLVGL